MACRRRAAEPDVAGPITAVVVNNCGYMYRHRINLYIYVKQWKGVKMGMFSKFRVVALAGLLLLTIGMVSACKVPEPEESSTLPPSIDNGVEVVYFHRAQRCSGCIHAQDMTEYTLNTYFADELEDGGIVFMALNLQDVNNSAMVQKYGAYTSSLFLNDVEGGVDSIEELTDIWFVLSDDEGFVDIVKTAIEECLAD
jgi:hypothetical protein